MLSEIIIQLMPHCNQAEGRVLEREMGKENTFDDPDAVLAACTAIVSGNTDSTIEDARREAGSMPEGTPRLAAIAAAAAMVPGGASPGTSTHPPRHNLGGTTAADADAAKRQAANAAAAALAAAVKRAEKGQERESKLLPVGTWCHKGTCRWKHGPSVPRTSDPDWVGPLDPEIEKDAAHVARIEGRRDAAAKRLHEEGKRSSPFPKKLKKHSVARPGGAATFAPPVDDDPSGDGMGRLLFLGEPGFAPSAVPSCPVTLGAVHGEKLGLCQEADADDDENSHGEWYMLSRVSDTGLGYTHSKYLIQNAFETAALRSLYETYESASLTNYGWGAEGAAALESALMMMVRVEPSVVQAPIESEPRPVLDGRALRQMIEDNRPEEESRVPAMHEELDDGHTQTNTKRCQRPVWARSSAVTAMTFTERRRRGKRSPGHRRRRRCRDARPPPHRAP